jgi:hypothetical protein
VCLCSEDWPCGSSTETGDKCYGNTGKTGAETACAKTCGNPAHYAIDGTTGRCKEIGTCASRTKNSSSTVPCGSGECYWDKGNSAENKCAGTCTNPSHYAAVGGTCELQDCSLRTENNKFVI